MFFKHDSLSNNFLKCSILTTGVFLAFLLVIIVLRTCLKSDSKNENKCLPDSFNIHLFSCIGSSRKWNITFVFLREAKKTGVDAFVQGTVVRGPLCPRDISPRRLLSKETLVQGDNCPSWKFETLRAVHIIFLSFYNQSIS